MSDSEGNSLNEEQIAEQIQALLAQLQANPFDFAVYVELINLHRAAGDLDETRAYRQQVHGLFCLPEQMWLEWINDEINLAGQDSAKVAEVVALFETALVDYHYRKVYKRYMRFLIERKLPDQAEVFERALRIWGLDPSKGDALWQLYAEYEKSDERKVATIARRRCALPLEGSKAVFDEYAKSETDAAKLARVQ